MVYWILGGYALVSIVTFAIYGVDKRRAGIGGRRTPERTLHLLEFIGGWPGALLGQQFFRHKRQKISFMLVFWFIVLIHGVFWLWYTGLLPFSGGWGRSN